MRVYGLLIFYRILILLMLVWGTLYLPVEPAYSVHLYLIAPLSVHHLLRTARQSLSAGGFTIC